MSGKELRRVHVIRQVLGKQIPQVKAGALLGLTARQVRRLLRRVEQEGDQGRALGFHAIAARPAVPVVTVKAGQRPRRPIVPKPDHKPDISTLGGSGHFYLGLTSSRLHLDSLFNPLVDCPTYGRLTYHSPLAGLVIE
ncbi:MAG: hypothetical protein P0120_07200 [Nitrospira sp.]|nr:hypothetical protein [Nitrospira sp.]